MGITIFVLGIPLLVGFFIFRRTKWTFGKKILVFLVFLVFLILFLAGIIHWVKEGFERGRDPKIINKIEIINNE